ncbi:ComEA family DNA-binding protein [Arthrobacter sp.]|uniref:ComEA family DNA-binding protein n=1 Tax=Arthrobacter sp. TaxID=1667 RepID=UPI002810FE88|nr:ComEA family DNA-binding protein [Arthrobacter sp.]
MSRRNPGAAPSADRARRVLAGNGTPDAGGLLEGSAFVGGADFVEEQDFANGAGSQYPRRTRWRTGRRAGLLIAFTAVILSGWFWWSAAANSPQVVPLSAVSSAAGEDESPPAVSNSGTLAADSGADAANEDDGGKIVVHVAGAVQTPGVVELPAGSRIHEAVGAAGGSTPGADLNRLNLAAVLTDGQKVHVPLVGEQLSADPGTGGDADPAAGSGAASTDKIDLNTASVDELGTLPRVGPVLAQRIVDWRKEHGNFKTVDELDAVDGVGPKMLEALLPLVTV